MVYIPFDIVLEIIRRSNVPSFFRFRSASKLYLETVDSDFFQTRCTDQDDLLLFSWSKNKLAMHLFEINGSVLKQISKSPLVNLPLKLSKKEKDPQNVLCSCKGVLLVRVYTQDGNEEIVLCNPIKGETLFLPPTLKESSPFIGNRYGLGYDESTNEFKVVCVYDSFYLGGEVYGLSTKSWRKIEDHPLYQIKDYPLCDNGSIHWMTEDPQSHYTVSFDIKTEKFSLASQFIYDADDNYKLTSSKPDGYLPVVDDFNLRNEEKVTMFTDSKWTKMSLINIDEDQVFESENEFFDIEEDEKSEDGWIIINKCLSHDDRPPVYEFFSYKSSLFSLGN